MSSKLFIWDDSKGAAVGTERTNFSAQSVSIRGWPQVLDDSTADRERDSGVARLGWVPLLIDFGPKFRIKLPFTRTSQTLAWSSLNK